MDDVPPYYSFKNQKGYQYDSKTFQSYGSLFGIDTASWKSIGQTTPLALRHPQCLNKLSAEKPCCPLNAPNEGTSDCVFEILDHNTLNMLSKIPHLS